MDCQYVHAVVCITFYYITIDIKIEDYHTHVWNLSPGQRKQLVLSAVIGSYSDALDNMKQSLKDYNKTLESYEVITHAYQTKLHVYG